MIKTYDSLAEEIEDNKLDLSTKLLEEKKRYFDASLYHGINDENHLHDFIKIYFGFNIPRKINPYNKQFGHTPPFQFLSDLYFQKTRNGLDLENRSAGKTTKFALFIELLMLLGQGIDITESGSIVRQAARCFAYLQDFLKEPLINERLVKLNISPAFMEFKYHNSVQLVTASIESLNGPHSLVFILDEIELVKWSVLQQGLSIAQSKGGRLSQNIFGSTRKYLTGTMQKLMDKASLMNIQIYKSNIFDNVEKCEMDFPCEECLVFHRCQGVVRESNGFYSLSDFVAKAQLLDEPEWQSEWVCNKPGGEGLVYDIFDENVHVMNKDKESWLKREIFDSKKKISYIGGVDFGWRVPSAFVLILISEKKEIFVIEEIYEKKFPIENLIFKIEALYRQWSLENNIYKLKLYADPSSPEDIDKMKRLGLNVEKGDNNLIQGIKSVIQKIRLKEVENEKNDSEYSFYISYRCKNLIDEFLVYSWEDNYKYEKVQKINDHALDALRYAIYTHFKESNKTIFSKEEIY